MSWRDLPLGPSHPQRTGGLTWLAEMKRRYGWDGEPADFTLEEEEEVPDFVLHEPVEEGSGLFPDVVGEAAYIRLSLVDGDAIPAARPDPKPARRLKASDAKPFGHPVCIVTGGSDPAWITRHHLVFRSRGGDDVPANLVWIDAFTHDAFHHGGEYQRQLIGAKIRAGLQPEHLAYVRGHRGGGEDWLEQVYPSAEPFLPAVSA